MIVFLSFFITLFLTPLMRGWAIKLGAVDNPNERKIHGIPIPLLGGVSIFLGFVISHFIYIPINNKAIGFFVASLIILAVGLYDDIFNLRFPWRLAIEVLVAIILIALNIKISIGSYITQNSTFILIIDGLMTIWWIVGVINAINFIDGLDGLAASITLWASGAFLFIGLAERNIPVIMMCLSLIGALLGFLPFNLYSAKIFMGDAGSTFIGFILGVISIFVFNQLENPFSISIPILILAIPILDMAFVVINRIANRESAFLPNKKHIHHRIMAKGLGQGTTLLFINCIAIGVAVGAIMIYLLQAYKIGMFLLGVVSVFIVIKSGLFKKGGRMNVK